MEQKIDTILKMMEEIYTEFSDRLETIPEEGGLTWEEKKELAYLERIDCKFRGMMQDISNARKYPRQLL